MLSSPWAIVEDELQAAVDRLEAAERSAEALLTKNGRPLEGTRLVQVMDGVAVLPIAGPIIHRDTWWASWYGMSSTTRLAREFAAAIEDDKVRAVVLSIASPGGEAFGIDELAAQIYAARERKPIVAYVGGYGASAAYWIASAADQVVASANSMLGSIGVVMPVYKGKSTAWEEIVSSRAPRKRVDVGTDDGRAYYVGLVDALHDEFAEGVAKHRGVAVDVVDERFGSGGLLVGRHAVEAGLADRLGSLMDVIAELATPGSGFRLARTAAGSSPALSTRKGPEKNTMDQSQKRTLMASLLASLGFSRQDAVEALAENPAALPVAVAQPPATNAGPTARERELEEKLNASEERGRTLAAVAREEKRKAFLAELEADERIVPAERDAVAAVYAILAEDDDRQPLKTGSRLDAFKSSLTSRPKHGLQTEAAVPEGAKTLPASGTEDADLARVLAEARAYAERENRSKGGK